MKEDAYRRDVTSQSVPRGRRAVGEIVAEQGLVVSGMAAAIAAFRICEPRVRVLKCVKDGSSAKSGDTLLRVSGKARSLLAAERTALNFLSHLSGIATLTRSFVRALPRGSRTRILDTRKTTPLLRNLEKEAVRHGGGYNHRRTLAEAVLLKDNHVALLGGVGAAVRSARGRLGKTMFIEVEVGRLRDLEESIAAGADRVLLDNMSDGQIRRAVRASRGRVTIEVSGGVTIDRIPRLARIGVDFISVGALTHSAPAAKLSMDIQWA